MSKQTETTTSYITGEFSVGRFTCTVKAGPDLFEVVWEPEQPKNDEFTEDMMKQYRRGRDSVVEEVAKRLGGSIVVVET